MQCSDAASVWAGWASNPEFGSSVNPIATRGADYAHHITASPPGFENPAAALIHYWRVSATFWKIVTAFKSHMTCYDLNLNS